MNILEKTKLYWGERVIKAQLEASTRKLATCNIMHAQSIGILFDATLPVSFEIVKELVKNITSKKNTVDVLGFVDSKQLIDHYLYRKVFEFFTRKQLTWYNKPELENVNVFIEKPFDLLLDLSLTESFPIRYILANSKAKFKAGVYREGQEYLDFMIDIEKEKDEMIALWKELEKDLHAQSGAKTEIEALVDSKAQDEIQLNFLINQLIHYLSILKP
jgi:hypothetical protein